MCTPTHFRDKIGLVEKCNTLTGPVPFSGPALAIMLAIIAAFGVVLWMAAKEFL